MTMHAVSIDVLSHVQKKHSCENYFIPFRNKNIGKLPVAYQHIFIFGLSLFATYLSYMYLLSMFRDVNLRVRESCHLRLQVPFLSHIQKMVARRSNKAGQVYLVNACVNSL